VPERQRVVAPASEDHAIGQAQRVDAGFEFVDLVGVLGDAGIADEVQHRIRKSLRHSAPSERTRSESSDSNGAATTH